MNFVIPMAGRGQRFLDAGFDKPKMLIESKGKTLLEWSVDSLPLNLCSILIFIILEEHENTFKLSKFIKSKYAEKCKLEFFFLKEVTNGQAETVYLSKHLWDTNKDLLIFNIDTYFSSSTLEKKLIDENVDGVLGAFKIAESSTKYSFAKVNEEGYIAALAEKEMISENALNGLYHFKISEDFIQAFEDALEKNERVKNEFYIAPLYNKLIENGKKLVLDFSEFNHILGTPEELNEFEKS